MTRDELRNQLKANIDNIEEILNRISPWYEEISSMQARPTGLSVHFRRKEKRQIGDCHAEAFWLLNGPQIIGELKETLTACLSDLEAGK